jgi:hypothetical protein
MATNLFAIDFVDWTREQAAELRRLRDDRSNIPLDLERLADEVEDFGSERKPAFENLIELVIEHLLKLAHSPAIEPRKKWMISVHAARRSAARRLTATLRHEAEGSLDQLFESARSTVVLSMKLCGEFEAINDLPTTNPYTLEQILDPDFWPLEPDARPRRLPEASPCRRTSHDRVVRLSFERRTRR